MVDHNGWNINALTLSLDIHPRSDKPKPLQDVSRGSGPRVPRAQGRVAETILEIIALIITIWHNELAERRQTDRVSSKHIHTRRHDTITKLIVTVIDRSHRADSGKHVAGAFVPWSLHLHTLNSMIPAPTDHPPTSFLLNNPALTYTTPFFKTANPLLTSATSQDFQPLLPSFESTRPHA
jgi:hypothetical protein